MDVPHFTVTRLCVRCSVKFFPANKQSLYCSRACRNAAGNDRNSFKSRHPGLPTATVGAIGKMQVCADLLSKGYEVFRAVSASCSCDIAILKDGKMLRIEARTGYRSKASGKLLYPKKSHDGGRSEHHAIILGPNEIVYLPELT